MTNPDDSYEYPGNELDLFAEAHHWKRYWHSRITPYLDGNVAEIGAGIGSNTELLRSDKQNRWLCVEPDRGLNQRLAKTVQKMDSSLSCETLLGTSDDVSDAGSFDSVIYMDVLEHIEADGEEVGNAARLLRPGGYLVMLGPAHNFLYSPFDEHVGHVRRYDTRNLPETDSSTLQMIHCEFLDSVGMLASLANRMLLRSSLPTLGQIKTWDNWMVPLSRILDPLTGRRLGKSILVVWEKQ